MSHLLAPEVDGTSFRWNFGETTFEVDAARGARITRFSLGAQDVLTGPDVNALNFGATFWTSPQSQWGWPPLVEHDSEPFTARRLGDEGAAVLFSGRPDAQLGIAATKSISVDGRRGVVTIEYGLRNHAAQPRAVAPWEISRHPTHGLTFFPRGDGVGPASTLAVTEEGGAVWFAYDQAAITGHQKLFAHGAEGWICHVDVARRLQLVKTFPEVARADQAPGEATIEIYADPGHTYVEVEQQGAHRILHPDEHLAWPVTWRLRSLPPSVPIRVGGAELLASARGLASV